MALDTMATTTDLSFEDLVPVAQGRVLYVLEWNSEDSLDGMKEAFAIVVLKRAGGCLLALPEGFLSVEDLREGGEMGSVLGPSVSMVVNAMHVDAPVGLEIPVVILDVDQAIVGAMRLAEEVEETAMPFFPDDPFALPAGEELVAKAMAWLQNISQDHKRGGTAKRSRPRARCRLRRPQRLDLQEQKQQQMGVSVPGPPQSQRGRLQLRWQPVFRR